MKTPINSILEELVSDVGLALGVEWRYRYQNYYDDPGDGLTIELSIYGMLVHSGGEAITYGVSDKASQIDWEVLRAGLIFFYRLIGQHVLPTCVVNQPCGLTKFAVGMTKAVMEGMRDCKVLVLTFADGKNDVQFKRA